ncbi:hypothetical protein AJ88_26750 [Mesorhizobium amorphae CCBAU 01583]|nr:hypothetical protein AJ88_26750 [Mesorhizobium amorphae CCBAU 01583]
MNFARLVSVSPMVAILTVAAISVGVMPSSAALALSGRTMSSGLVVAAVEVGLIRPGTDFIWSISASLAFSSAAPSSPTRVIDTLAPEEPSAPNWMRAPAMSLSLGEVSASNSCWLTVRSARGLRLTVTVAVRTSAELEP